MWRGMISGVVIVGIVICGAGAARAQESGGGESIEHLPKDVWNLAFVWTEPFKQVAEQTRQHDPVNGLWLGLLGGSIKSVERAANVFLKRDSASPTPEPGKQFHYTF